jgi:hypothetical protein
MGIARDAIGFGQLIGLSNDHLLQPSAFAALACAEALVIL